MDYLVACLANLTSKPGPKDLVVIIADYDGCFDVLFRFSPVMAIKGAKEETEKTETEKKAADGLENLQAWLCQKTNDAGDVLFFVGSNRQSKLADLAVNAFKTNPRGDPPVVKYPYMVGWIQEQKDNQGWIGLCHKDYEALACVPRAVLGQGYRGKPWTLVPSLLEDRISGRKEGTEWFRRDTLKSSDAPKTRFKQIDTKKEGMELADPVEMTFDLFDDVTYYNEAPGKAKAKLQEQIMKLGIVRHQLESMASIVANGSTSYNTIHCVFLDDRADLLEYVGPRVGVEDNLKLRRKLQGKAKRVNFSTVRSDWKGEKEPPVAQQVWSKDGFSGSVQLSI